MKWKKLGNVYCPSVSDKYTHAMLPVVEIVDAQSSSIRVYYTHRDNNNYGFPTFLDAVISDDNKFTITYNHHEPIIDKGELGNFDDSGVNVTSIVRAGSEIYYYYFGWNLGVTVPFRNAIGVAKSVGSGKNIRLLRQYPGPILDRAPKFPGLCAVPCVIAESGFFRMYFAQGKPWIIKDGHPNVSCCISYAESTDGFSWVRAEEPSVTNSPTDHVVTTPFVVFEDDIYKMWYSYRGERYRIGYAESNDGKTFIRKDSKVGITVSQKGWDSEMVCYPKVFDLNDRRYMIYCGNSYGRTGFGLAVLESF